MSFNKVKVAVVEDNGMARANLRNHLLDMGFNQIGCFSNGREFKAHIRHHKIDLVLMDFHLGQNKNGVEVLQELQQQGYISLATCVMFVTSDRLPMIIGQIVDVHPEALIIKPYTISNLMKNIANCLNMHGFLLPIYRLMDEDNYEQALAVLDILLEGDPQGRKRSALIKLRARILTKLKRYSEAAIHYQNILDRSNKVIWAKWGLIQNLFLDGHLEESEKLLLELTASQLTNDKACEWLARISVGNNQYTKAENYMHQIREGELSIPAARLKAYIYQAQEKGDDAITLLEKKRESNRSIRERYDEISLDLARCYLTEAELKSNADRTADIQVAKYLIGAAGRKVSDPSLSQKKDYLLATAAFLEGNLDKSSDILTRPGMDNLHEAEISTITDAIQAWTNIGNKEKAKEYLHLCKDKLENIDEGNNKTTLNMLVTKSEEGIGERRPEALEYNKSGLQKFSNKQYTAATQDFYQAYILFPREIAFSLNLLQSMVDAELLEYEQINTVDFLAEMQNRKLNASNQNRLNKIFKRMVNKNNIYFLDPTSEESVKKTK
ncbi:response regulator [Paraglaciecola aquimarina]|uniref:Response regulator n=1 Tax=Paraglaciecola aquimarina TaxID=1235557 RepID=A0ABU3SVD5_9ALTE|nr:response regulator [Paraglaciecola aquimarina]MDU0353958.1 response regulator [Paraglaciecola aquimarina]